MARIDPGFGAPYGSAPVPGLPDLAEPDPEPLTLLDLVRAVAEFAESDAEVVAAVKSLLASGRVVLVGQFCAPHLLPD